MVAMPSAASVEPQHRAFASQSANSSRRRFAPGGRRDARGRARADATVSAQWAALRSIKFRTTYASSSASTSPAASKSRAAASASARMSVSEERRIREAADARDPQIAPAAAARSPSAAATASARSAHAVIAHEVLVAADVDEQEQRLESRGRVLDEQTLGLRQQADGRLDLFPLGRAPPGRGEAPARPQGEGPRPVVLRPQGQAVGPRLVEVVAGDLVEVGESVAGGPLEPVGELLVQLGPLQLRQAVVRGVADEQVPEPIGLAAAVGSPVGPDELLADEAHQLARHAGATLGRRQLGHVALAELLADDRGPLDRPALAVAQPVEARREERLDRRRDRDRLEVADDQRAVGVALDEAVVEEHLDDLLDVQRVAVGGGGDPLAVRAG